jgi:hypothetical protein
MLRFPLRSFAMVLLRRNKLLCMNSKTNKSSKILVSHASPAKGKEVPVLNSLNSTPDVWGNGGIAPSFLVSTLAAFEWSASRPCRFNPGERPRSAHWIGGYVDLRAGQDPVEKKKFIAPTGNRTRAI